MAKRFTKPTINWAEMEKKVPPDQKTKFLAFKGKSFNYLRIMQSNPPEPPKIDWDHYKKVVPIPGLVDNFKTSYESFKVPYPDDKLSAEIDKQWASLQVEIKKYSADMQKEISTAKKELDRINALPKYEEMTMEMFFDMFPAEALDPVNRPTFWPHNKEEQPGYLTAEQKAMQGGH